MHRRSRLVLVALAAALAPVLAACGGDSEPGGSGEESLGQEVYGAECAICHGPDGEGGTGPQLGDGAVEANLTVEEHTEVVRDGGDGMPAWEGDLTPEEIDAVVTYEREELGR